VEIKVDSIDKRGCFLGNVICNKVDWGTVLLKEGLAVTFGQTNMSQEYEKIE
jgi:endonuclease YncB( thermonuclease family)